MKKLLFFTMLLFITLSFQTLSDAYGCGVTIPIEVCRNPGGVQNNNGNDSSNNTYSPTYYGAIAINEKTGDWATAYNYTDKKSAKKSVKDRCQGDCKVIQMSPSECGAFAYSKIDEVSAYEATGFWWTGQATQQELLKKAEDRALTKCKNKNGKSCKIEVSVCSSME